MTLPASGPISLSQIAAEFGGTAPHSLSEYYGKAAGIPASGQISFSHFHGKTSKEWTFVGASSLQSGYTISFPTTAQAGDLAVWCGTVASSGTPPSGWTLIASGATLQAYKVCTGGETSATWQSVSGAVYATVLLFRPSGGGATLTGGATDSPIAPRTLVAGSTPSLIVAIGNRVSNLAWAPILPGTWNNVVNWTNQPALYVSWRFLSPGESTGSMQLDSTGKTARQTFGIFGIS